MLHTLAERERLTGVAYMAAWLALLASIAACLWLAARIAWHLFPAETPNGGSAVTLGGQTGADTGGDHVDLGALNLFGRSPQAVSLSATANAPDTSLDLRLLGTITSDEDGAAMAIIGAEDRQSVYALGDELPGDAKLHEVHAEHVILIHLGRYETLRLRTEEERPPRVTSGANPRTAPPAAAPNLGSLDWQAMQRQARLDPTALAKQIRALPIIENGQPIGVRLQAGRDAALIGKLGLRPTDIITAVNGIPLTDPSRAFELINQLNSQTRFNVDLRRDGREMTLNIDANSLSQ